MHYSLKIYDNDGLPMVLSRSADLDDVITDVRHFKDTPQYNLERAKELENCKFKE
jgi:hypothetical protein